MKILLLEPFFGGSHKKWAEGLQRFSSHEIKILSLSAKNWKWRMHGAAVSFARMFDEMEEEFDLVLATDMLDLATFKGLVKRKMPPLMVYFHENQLAYPWSPDDQDVRLQRDHRYGFINYTTCLAADHVFFNSKYNRDSFLDGLPAFLKMFPDNRELENVERIREKSEVLYLGMDLQDNGVELERSAETVILWNHRWEFDKGPDLFFGTLIRLKEEKVPFRLVVLGESFGRSPEIFERARKELSDRILHWGFLENESDYFHWLKKADILPVTSGQDFFGGSVVEAMYYHTNPLLPNRLAYPEHIPVEFKEGVFYSNNIEFAEKLKQMILHFPTLPTRNWVEKYKWENMIAEYDRKFGAVIKKLS